MFKRILAIFQSPKLTADQTADVLKLLGEIEERGFVYDGDTLLEGRGEAVYWASRLGYIDSGSAWNPSFVVTKKGRKALNS